MKGLELARAYYEAYGAPMLEGEFPELKGKLAVGLCGSGSECCGFDDELSRDHDFEPGFCIFLPGEEAVDSRTAFRLERAYAKLPAEFEGCRRSPVSAVGGQRHGVLRLAGFLTEHTGTPDGRLSLKDWLTVPEQSLLEAGGGELWRDDSGEFTAIRAALSELPEDIRLKKLAGEVLLMAQSGEYNYARCLGHGERAAAQLAVQEYVNAAIHGAFLINGRLMPYYKWRFKALRELLWPALTGDMSFITVHPERSFEEQLEWLLTSPNDPETAALKQRLMEELSALYRGALTEAGLSFACDLTLEPHAYSVNQQIKDANLRNMHILAGVKHE